MKSRIKSLINRPTLVLGMALTGLFLCTLVAGDVAARDNERKTPADAGQLGIIEKVDVANRTVTLGGKVYAVPENSNLVDAAGKRIRLRDLNGVGSRKSADMVEFWARGNGRNSKPEIIRLSVKPPMRF